MYKLLACLVAVAAISLTAGESQAQFYRGGSGISIGIGGVNGGIGYSSFNRGYGRSVSGLSINLGNGGFSPYGGFAPVYRGGYGGGFYGAGRPVVVARPVVQVAPVYRGGYYGGHRGGGYYGGHRHGGYRSCGGGW
ncbi:hypothetical protein [Mariniblastus fucicola]|uniref:Uncharacterized protein n=1 Tax=Mariniblastus fucicola TaxID=980251 RepID=A0A5B9PPR0_9BACT|nr:hypothetical protein [Mariniblastus fucicola]QEG24263.1 hypothetical protein MFFC18_41810 [Mariniblastus fucicola]